jgi:shikimate dehydrogenase
MMTARHAYVLGWPVGHSRSPAMHDAAFAALRIDAVMHPLAVTPDEIAPVVARLRAEPMLGASVTIPHKLAVAALCDELAPEARAIGAVNCLELDGERLIGHNTDAGGFLDGLVAAGFDVRGKRAVLLGAGGAARGVAYGLRGGGAVAIDIVARRPEACAWAKAWPWMADTLRECFARADLVVDCTSAGLEVASDAALAAELPLAELPPPAWIGTLVYHRRTRLLDAAAGHPTFDGRPMLVHQAARAFRIWTHLAAPIEIMARALDASLVKTT